MSNDSKPDLQLPDNHVEDANIAELADCAAPGNSQDAASQILRAAEAASAFTSPVPSVNVPQLVNVADVTPPANSGDVGISIKPFSTFDAGNLGVSVQFAVAGNTTLIPQLTNTGNIGLIPTLIEMEPDDLQSSNIEAASQSALTSTNQFAGDGAQISQNSVPENAVDSMNILNNADLNIGNHTTLMNLQHLQHAASTMSSTSIQKASLSVASNLVIQSGGNSLFSGNGDESGARTNTQGLLACRLPQPPDGRWLGCGQAAHAPIPCYAWQQMGLTHSNQIHDRVFAFTSSQLSASSIPLNQMCAMRQPPFPDQNGPLKQGCGQLAHPDSVCATWIAAGVLTLPEVRQTLLEWKKRFPNANVANNDHRMIRKLPDKDRCVIPQPPDGVNRGCSLGVQHRGTVCESWKAQNVTDFEGIRPALLAWHQEHPDPAVELCDFIQPPDGSFKGCGAPNHRGRICAAWAELDVLTRQEAIKKVRTFRAQSKPRKAATFRPDAEKLCNLPQPPDGRVIGCGEPFHRMAVCNSWLAFGVLTRDAVKIYVDKYREDTGTTANFVRVCRALQPPDGRVKGCGLGWHRGVCPSWQALEITDRKVMMEYIQSNIENVAAHSSGVRASKRRVSFSGISRVTEFPDYANDPDLSLRYFVEGDFDRCVQELTKRISKYPDRASLYNNRGIAYAERGWTDLAVRDFFKAIELDPTYSDAFANRGIVRASLNKPLLAGDDCQKALAFPGGHSHHCVRLAYAMTLYESGDFPKCVIECESVLNEDPNLAQAKILMGLANGALQKYDLAVHFLESAAKSGFEKDRVLALLELARKRANETRSAPNSEVTSAVNHQAETEGSSIAEETHYDEDLVLSDSGTDFNEMDSEQYEVDVGHSNHHDEGDRDVPDNEAEMVTDSNDDDDDTVSDDDTMGI